MPFLFCFFLFFSPWSQDSVQLLPYLTIHQSQTHHLSVPTTNHPLSLSSNLLLVLLKTNSASIGLWKGNSGFFGYWAFWEFDVGVMIFESWDLGFHYCHGGQLSSGWTWSERSVTNCRLGWLQLRWASVAYLVDGIFMRLSTQSLGFVILARLVHHCIW